METVSVFEAKNKLSGLLSAVEKHGKTFLVCRNGKPVAEIVAHKRKNRLKGDKRLHVEVNGELYGDDMSGDWECLT